MAPPLITARQLNLRFGEKTVFKSLDFSIQANEKICLVGRNGSGKSTLLKALAGLIAPDQGELFVQPGTRMGYLEQDPDLTHYKTLRAYALTGLFQDQVEEEYRVDAALSLWELNPLADPGHLSGGEKKRAALARLFASEPDILLLDEPTNHLDLTTIEMLEKALKGYRGSQVIISHDRAFLKNLTDVTLWLDRGIMRRLDQGYQEFETWSSNILELEERECQKMDKLIAEETVWSHQGITARRKRNQGRLRRLKELRSERSEITRQQGRAKLEIDVGAVSGKLIVEARNINKSFDGQPVIHEFSTKIVRGDRIGIIGPNGSGKSTLLKILTGQLPPDSGHVRIGKNLTVVYFDQSRQALDPEETLWGTLCDRGTDQVMVRGEPRHVVSYLRDFLFDASQARSPVKSLSGGEKSRLLLAKALAQPSNVLILDEPTNDLDLDTLDLLQEVLSEYEGTILLVSHDRNFLDEIVTSTIVFEEKGRLTEYAGGYSDYLLQRPQKNPGINVNENRFRSNNKGEPEKSKNNKKLSFNKQYRYEEIPKTIALHDEKIKKIEEKLQIPSFYLDNPLEFERCTLEHAALKAQIEQLENEWLEIETLKETLGA